MIEMDFLLSQGVAYGQINDMWRRYWDSIGVTQKNWNDAMKFWLRSLGYTGALPDMLSKWRHDTATDPSIPTDALQLLWSNIANLFTGGGNTVNDFEGVLVNGGADNPAFSGMRLDGADFLPTDDTSQPNHPVGENYIPAYLPDRQDSTAYAVGDEVQWGMYYFTCTTAGTSDAAAPPVDDTVNDGTVVWSRLGRYQDKIGYLSEEARTNLFLNSKVPVTQNITTAADDYTLSVVGSGSITLSGTGSGVATEGTPVTFTATAGTLICTVAGSLDWVQVELGDFKTSLIETEGSTVTRPATILEFPSEGVLRENDIAIQGVVVFNGMDTSDDYILGSSSDANNQLDIYFRGSLLRFQILKQAEGSYALAYTLMTPTAGVPIHWQAFVSKIHGLGIRLREWNDLSWGEFYPWNIDTAAADIDFVLNDVLKIGSKYSGADQFNGNIPVFQTKFTDDPKAWLEQNPIYGEGVFPPFDGGLFANGGFEDGFAGWANFGSGDNWVASAGADTVENPSAVAGKFLYQNKTLISGATYEISALKISGDAVVTFCIDDADSHISIEDGAHQFIGAGAQMSYGLTLSEVGTVVTVCDDVRMIEVIPANAVTANGDYVRHNGAIVTYTP